MAANAVTSEEEIQFRKTNWITADPGGREVLGEGLRPFACRVGEFESRRRHGYISLVSIVFSGTGLCVERIISPEQSYGVWCVCV